MRIWARRYRRSRKARRHLARMNEAGGARAGGEMAGPLVEARLFSRENAGTIPYSTILLPLHHEVLRR